MAKDISFEWYKPIAYIMRDVGVNKELMEHTAREWHRLYDFFTPFQTGALDYIVQYYATETKASVYHKMPYARRLYHGDRFNFSKTHHPLASAYWDRAALAAGKGIALVRSMQAFVNRGGR